MTDWQPIETAERKDSGGSAGYVDLWAKRWNPETGNFEFKRFTDCFWSGAEMRWIGVAPEYRATHWMPLPEPPK